jgi:ABC-type uncharacterized transport system substrate-binding protein
MPLTVGILHSGTSGGPGRPDDNIQRFRDALAATYNGAERIVYRAPLFANDNRGQLPIHAQTLVGANVDVLVAAGGTASAEAAKNATHTIPIVFTSVTDPAQAVPNPPNNRNMTGVCARTSGLDADRLQLLHELYPQATKFGALFNLRRSNYDSQRSNLQGAAMVLGLDPLIDRPPIDQDAPNIPNQIDQAFLAFRNAQCAAVLVTADPLFNDQRDIVVRTGPAPVAPPRDPPAIYQWSEFVEDEGGLISYGPNLTVAYQLAGLQTARILEQLPLQPGGQINYPPVLVLDNFELVINLKTAKRIQKDIPATLLKRADKIIV